MKTSTPFVFSQITALIVLLGASFQTHAAPRSPNPPWPEATLGIFGWDESHWFVPQRQRAVGADTARMTESWSGFALTRGYQEEVPVAIPAIGPDGRPLVAPDFGAIRFWFNPAWSSVAKLDRKSIGRPESGPGQPVRLLELVNLGGQFPDIRWTLHANAEGNQVRVTGIEFGRVKEMLAVPLNVVADEWRLITFSYSPEGTQLWLDGRLLGTGAGIRAGIAGWEDRLGLIVGSAFNGLEGAKGMFEEVTLFDYWPAAAQQEHYYQGVFKQVRLGPVGTPEEERLKQDLVWALDGPPAPGEGGGGGGGGTNTPAYNYDPGTFYVEILSATNQQAQLKLHNTIPDLMYELRSTVELTNGYGWTGETPFVMGTPGATSTLANVPWLDRTNTLFLHARSWVDTDGDGLPDWWELAHGLDPDLPDTGDAGISDGYKDGDGDGWTNLDELQNGTSPSGFNTPPAPRGVMAAFGVTTTNVNVSWTKNLGNVTSYTVERYWDGLWQTSQVSAASSTFTDTLPAPTLWQMFYSARYWIRANYASGSSEWSEPVSPDNRAGGMAAWVARGPQGKQRLIVSALPASTASIRLWRVKYDVGTALTNFTIAASSFANGVYELPAAWTPLLGADDEEYQWWAQPVNGDGSPGVAAYAGNNQAIPFFDGREQLRQNLAFLLRVANRDLSFDFNEIWGVPSQYWFERHQYPEAYADARLLQLSGSPTASLDEWLPFVENHAFRNFAFSVSHLDGSGGLTTGAVPGSTFPGTPSPVGLHQPPLFEFTPPGTQGTISAVLPASVSQWLYFDPTGTGTGSALDRLGISLQTGANWYWLMSGSAKNLFGLPYVSAKLADINGGVSTLNAGSSVLHQSGVFYPETAQPQLQTVGYYFGKLNAHPVPGHETFNVTNTTPLLVANVGQYNFTLAGYAKQAILNGYTNKFGYLGQYFEKAQKQGTTNETGILSPYGEFFPTEPGPVALVTMPDLATGARGTGVVHVIKLQLDVNHDGVMDLSWSGPDNANTPDRPFRFWVNNDNDEPAVTGTDPKPERDVPINQRMYSVADGIWGKIETQRNLEDLARLWVRGVPPVKASDGYSVTLEIFPWSGNPHIRVYRARESDGGIGYLTNTTSAANQLAVVNEGGVNVDYGLSIGHVSPDVPLTLPLASGGGLSRSNFLFEASGAGKGQLILTVWKDETVVAKHLQEVEFKDVKEMYEQVLVTQVIQKWPLMVETNLVSSFAPPKGPTLRPDETPELAVFVHGWRMSHWHYENFSDTMFKRLYWAGYRGRFASLRWPTLSSDTSGELRQYLTYNRSEHIAFKSGAGTAGYLNDLRNRFPEHTISVAAHSMGNIVMMEALKQLAAASQRPIDHYVMMQAAVPAHSFDTSVTNLPLFTTSESRVPTPNTYHNYAAGVTNALREDGEIVNFYNVQDFALNAWQVNQSWGTTFVPPWTPTMKPNTYLGYYTTGTAHHLQTNEWNGSWLFGLLVESYSGPTRSVTATHEIMPFVSRPRSKAVGAQGGMGGQVQGGEVNLQGAGLGFTQDSEDHSGQFNWNIHRLRPFYDQLRASLFP
jgi:hypothetical protein